MDKTKQIQFRSKHGANKITSTSPASKHDGKLIVYIKTHLDVQYSLLF